MLQAITIRSTIRSVILEVLFAHHGDDSEDNGYYDCSSLADEYTCVGLDPEQMEFADTEFDFLADHVKEHVERLEKLLSKCDWSDCGNDLLLATKVRGLLDEKHTHEIWGDEDEHR